MKHNIKRFPKDFIFQLAKEGWEGIRLRVETLENQQSRLRSQIVILNAGRGKHSKYLPYAFTERIGFKK